MNPRLSFVGVFVVAMPGPATARAQALDTTEASGSAAPVQAEPATQPESLEWQFSKKYPINEDDPESSVPNKKQRLGNAMEFGYLVQDFLEGAEMARKRGDYHSVVRYYRAVVKAIPERAKSWGKLCEAYAGVNDHARASQACGTALSLPGVELQDYTRFVHETLLLPGKPTPENTARLRDVLDHLDKQPDVQLATAQLRCEAGVAIGDSRMLEIGTAALTRLDPNNPKTVVYQWTLEMRRGNTEAAGRLLRRAQALKLPSENIERMEALTVSGGHGRGYLWKGLVAVFFLISATGALLLAHRRRAQLSLTVR